MTDKQSHPSIKARNLCMYVCTYVCGCVCSSHSTKTICQIDFKLGRCVADDLRRCVCTFNAVWMCDSFVINKISCHITLICFFFCVESMSKNTKSASLPLQPTLWSKVGLHLNCSLLQEQLCPACRLRSARLQRTASLALHNIHSFALLIYKREGE